MTAARLSGRWWTGSAAAVFAAVVAAVIVSQFFRASNGVIAPELMRDTGLAPDTLGLVNGSFFVALAVAQIPCGIAFDRFGPRRVIAALSVMAVLGSVMFAFGQSPAALVAARFVIGLGCAGSFMGAVVLASRWAPGDRFTQVLSWIFALSNLGTLMATAPLALASGAFGWRAAFLGTAALTGVLAVIFYLGVRDTPVGHSLADTPPETLGKVMAGLREVWRTPNLIFILALHTVAYATLLTVQGLWAGPYLNDVHGLGPVARGNVLLVMAVFSVLGILAYGPMDRWFNSRKKVVLGGGSVTVAILLVLTLVPGLPTVVAVPLLVLLGGIGPYSFIIVAHGRSLFPDHLVGRGATTVKMAQVAGCARLPMLSGVVIDSFGAAPGGSAPAIAYQAAFGLLALLLAAGLCVYSRAPDSRPQPAG